MAWAGYYHPVCSGRQSVEDGANNPTEAMGNLIRSVCCKAGTHRLLRDPADVYRHIEG